MSGALNKAQELLDSDSNYKSLKQFENEDNPNIHYRTTAVEIYNDIEDFSVFIFYPHIVNFKQWCISN